MKTFRFEFPADSVLADLNVEDIANAVESMARSQEEKSAGKDIAAAAIVAVIDESDLTDAVAHDMAAQQARVEAAARLSTFTNILIALVKQSGNQARLTQSELDETKGWGLAIGPGDNCMHIVVKSPSGLVLAHAH